MTFGLGGGPSSITYVSKQFGGTSGSASTGLIYTAPANTYALIVPKDLVGLGGNTITLNYLQVKVAGSTYEQLLFPAAAVTNLSRDLFNPAPLTGAESAGRYSSAFLHYMASTTSPAAGGFFMYPAEELSGYFTLSGGALQAIARFMVFEFTAA